MIHFSFDAEKVNTWLLNVALLGLAFVEFALVAYVLSLTAYEMGIIR